MRRASLLVLVLAATSAANAFAQQGRDIRVEPFSGERWAVLVGVDTYKYVVPNLTYCGADVRALGERLIQAGFGKDRVVVLHDDAGRDLYPNKANIEKQLRLTLESVGAEDFLFLGFSGHGVRLEGKSYLCPYDAQMEPAGLLAIDAIYKQLQNCRAKFKLFLVDACQNEESRPRELVTTRAGAEVKSFALAQEANLPKGILLVTSCSPGQKAVEEPKFGHGVFTYFLLEGLTGRANADGGDTISLLEWTGYASSRTRAYVRTLERAQNPAMKGEFPDFDLVKVTRTVMPPTPTTVKATFHIVREKENTALPGALVRVYRTPAKVAATPVQLAEGRSDVDGRVSLLVPIHAAEPEGGYAVSASFEQTVKSWSLPDFPKVVDYSIPFPPVAVRAMTPFSDNLGSFGQVPANWVQKGAIGNEHFEIERPKTWVSGNFTLTLSLTAKDRNGFRLTLVGANGQPDAAIEGGKHNAWSGTDDWSFKTPAGQARKGIVPGMRTFTLQRQGKVFTFSVDQVFNPRSHDTKIATFVVEGADDFEAVRIATDGPGITMHSMSLR